MHLISVHLIALTLKEGFVNMVATLATGRSYMESRVIHFLKLTLLKVWGSILVILMPSTKNYDIITQKGTLFYYL